MQDEELIPFMEGNSVSICSYGNDRYAPFMGILVFSIIANSNQTQFYDIVLLSNNISGQNKKNIVQLAKEKPWVRIRFVECAEKIQRLKLEEGSSSFTVNACLRLLVFSEIFARYDRMITLDADMLVLADIAELNEVELGSKPIAAAKDIFIPYIIGKGLHGSKAIQYQPVHSYFVEMGLRWENYFNSGCLLMDLKWARRNHIFARIQDIMLHRFSVLLYDDQDILNMLYQDHYLELPLKWNGMSPYALMTGAVKLKESELPEDYIRKVGEAGIIHYLGIRKPWEDREALYADKYMYYARKTVWLQEILESQEEWERKQLENGTSVFDAAFPIGSRRRRNVLRLAYRINDWAHGWR